MPNHETDAAGRPTHKAEAVELKSETGALPSLAKRRQERAQHTISTRAVPRPRRRGASRRGAIKLERWLLKGVSQMKLFAAWMRDLEEITPLLFRQKTLNPNGFFENPRVETPADRPEAERLRYRDERLAIVLTTTPLPDALTATKRNPFGGARKPDVSSHEFSGYLLFLNFFVAKSLVATRKTVRPKLSQGAWPANDLLINPALVQELQNERYAKLCTAMLDTIKAICREISEHPVIVYIRLGLDVCPGERSLLVCAMGNSPEDARDASRKIWRRLLKQPFNELN